MSNFALPHDDFDALWEARLEKGLLARRPRELSRRHRYSQWLNSEGVELTCEEAARLFESYTGAYFSMMFREFEGWEHVARKSFPLMADVAEVRKFYVKQSAHGDVPVPKLIDKNECGNDRALLRTMVQQKTGIKPAKNLTRDSLVRRIVLETERTNSTPTKEFARVMHFISNDIKKADDELKKAVKIAVKKFIVDEWNGERKKDYLRKLAEERCELKSEKPAADVAGLFDGHRRPVEEKVMVNTISLDCNFPNARMYASPTASKEVLRFFLTFTPPPSSSHERSIRENPSRFPRGTDVTRATADARRRRRRRQHERFDVRPALVETRGAHCRPSARRDDDARDDATANGYPEK